MACCGDVPTLETLAAVDLLRSHVPELKVRVVNVVDLMKLQPAEEHPHGLTHKEFDTIFTKEKPIIFAFHGYPWLIHRLTYRRTNHPNLHVRGYKEEGTTTTPFDMAVLNQLDRFNLVNDVIERVPQAGRARSLFPAGDPREADRAQALRRQARRRHAGSSRLEVGQRNNGQPPSRHRGGQRLSWFRTHTRLARASRFEYGWKIHRPRRRSDSPLLSRIRDMRTFIMVALVASSGSFSVAVAAAERSSPSLPRSQPEAQGISSSAILAFVDEAEKKIDALHSFMLVRHGHVVAEGWWSPYQAESRHALYSLSKSFTSTAVGLAIAEGKLSIDDDVLKFFPDDAPKQPSANLKAMRVSDLLRMSTGHQAEPRREPGDGLDQVVPGAARPFQAGHSLPVQYVRNLHALGHRSKSRRA